MNPFDILIIVILSFCLIRGLFRGLVKELASIIGVIAGFYAAYFYFRSLSPHLTRWIADTAYLNIISFLLIFCGVFVLIGLLGVLLRFLLKITFLSWFDRLCGAGFGAVKAILIAAVLLTVFTAFLSKDSSVVRNSLLSPHVMILSEQMARFIGADMKTKFAANMKTIKEAWGLRK
ncbi:MAG: CvpA family protein [Thermodesulfobacteriota bacterium]